MITVSEEAFIQESYFNIWTNFDTHTGDLPAVSQHRRIAARISPDVDVYRPQVSFCYLQSSENSTLYLVCLTCILEVCVYSLLFLSFFALFVGTISPPTVDQRSSAKQTEEYMYCVVCVLAHVRGTNKTSHFFPNVLHLASCLFVEHGVL